MTEHISHLHPEPFAKIKSGKKDIEVRLNDEKRRQFKVGDNLRFISRADNEEMLCKIIGLCWFQDFAALVQTLGAIRCGWDKEYTADKYNSDMEKYYTKEEVMKYGALGIVLER